MERRKWVGWGVLVFVGAAFGAYYKYWRPSPTALSRLNAAQVFSRADKALHDDSFSEILAFQNNLLPLGLNISQLVNLPVPDSAVRTVALYEDSPTRWRMQELNVNNAVLGVVARAGTQVATYMAKDNERTLDSLPQGLAAAGSPWELPSLNNWRSLVSRGRFADRRAYEVTLTPRNPGTLWGSLIYWFDGSSFLPLGMEVENRAGAVSLQASVQLLKIGFRGSGANLPLVGRKVAWKFSGTLSQALEKAGPWSGRFPRVSFPLKLGPLSRVSQHQVGNNALAVYGNGPGRVLVVDMGAKLFKGPGAPFFHPLAGWPGSLGVRDGIFTVVTFRHQGREVTLFSSRPQSLVEKWAKAAWQ